MVALSPAMCHHCGHIRQAGRTPAPPTHPPGKALTGAQY